MNKSGAKSQRGAAAIEFAFVFTIVFMIFYGIVGYFLPFLLAASYQEIASEALRDAIRDPGYDTYSYLTVPQQTRYLEQRQAVASAAVDRSWIPDGWKQSCSGYGDAYLNIDSDNTWKVCLRLERPSTKLIPPLVLFGLSGNRIELPKLPDEIRGEAKVKTSNN